MTTEVQREAITRPADVYTWKITTYTGNVPHNGPEGRTGTEEAARDAADATLRQYPPGVEAYAAVIQVSTTDPMQRVHRARGERSPQTGAIQWFDIVP